MDAASARACATRNEKRAEKPGRTVVLVQMLPARAQLGMRSVQHFAASGQKRYNEKETAAFMLPAAYFGTSSSSCFHSAVTGESEMLGRQCDRYCVAAPIKFFK